MPVPLSPQSTNIQQPSSGAIVAPTEAKRQADVSQPLKGLNKSDSKPPKARTDSMQQQPVTTQQSHTMRLARKSSKPIINWFQRKLLASTRARRASDGDAALRAPSSRSAGYREKRRTSVPVPPLPTSVAASRQRNSKKTKPPRPASTVASTKPNTISLNEEDDGNSVLTDGHAHDSVNDLRRASSALDSVWSPNSILEADEDASVRPLPPSAPPSPSPSRSSSSYLSDPRTFASMTASTKPTTLLSVDLNGGMAHIAQAPPTPTLSAHRLASHLRSHSNGGSGSVTFYPIPLNTNPTSQPSSNHGHRSSPSRGGSPPATLQAPQHTTHHPRNNPRPSSPPLDDASVLTLASSAFGMPGNRIGVTALAMSGRTSLADDSISHFSNPTGLGSSTYEGENDGENDEDRLLDAGDNMAASVRALRPRSSRRNSWESEVSRWSARLGGGGGVGGASPSTPSGLRERSLWTQGSWMTGARSIAESDSDAEERSEGTHPEGCSQVMDEQQHSHVVEPVQEKDLATKMEHVSLTSTAETETEAAPQQEQDGEGAPELHSNSNSTPPTGKQAVGETAKERSLETETPKGAPIPLEDVPSLPSSSETTTQTEKQDVDESTRSPQSAATTDGQTDVFVSAPSTPLPL